MLYLDTLAVIGHVLLGTLAVAMGAVALAARKGAVTHVLAGRVFGVSMGLSSMLGALLGILNYTALYITFHAGILGATLVVSGVLAVRITARGNKRLFGLIAVINGLNGAGLLIAGFYAAKLPETILFGFPAADYFFLFGMAFVAFVGDVRLLLGKRVSRKRQVAQHLLRMCTGFFIAAGSAFTGPGAKAFPIAVQNSGLLSLPEMTILALMLFWLFKTLRPRPSIEP
jgi:uncharacterized membrane protein